MEVRSLISSVTSLCPQFTSLAMEVGVEVEVEVEVWSSGRRYPVSFSLVRSLHRQSGQQGESGCLLQIFPAPVPLCLQ